MSKWRLRRGIHIVGEVDGAVLLYHLGRRLEIRCGLNVESLGAVLSLLRGACDRNEVRGDSSKADSEIRLQFFDLLRNSDLLVEVADGEPVASPLAEFADAYLGIVPSQSQLEQWTSTPIVFFDALSRSGNGATDIYRSELENAGFRRFEFLTPEEDSFGADSFVIAIGTWLKPSALENLNRRMLSLRRRWLLVTEDEFGGSIGPYFGLCDGPCWQCIQTQRDRLVNHASRLELCRAYFEKTPAVQSGLPNSRRALATAAALETIKLFLAPDYSKINSGVIEFDHLNHHTDYHALLAESGCIVCDQRFKLSMEAR